MLYKCSECKKALSNSTTLKRHMKFCGKTEEQKLTLKNLSCDHCKYRTDQKCHLEQHIFRLHFLKHHKVSKCLNCNKNFASPKSLKDHSKICAKGEDEKNSRKRLLMRFSCDLCDYTTLRKYDLSKHIQAKHVPSSQYSYVCSKCKKKFSSSFVLRYHSRVCGLSEEEKRALKRLTCDHCQHKFNFKSDLKKHVKAKHLPKDSNSSTSSKHKKSLRK